MVIFATFVFDGGPAVAHPLGNFTINHLVKVAVGRGTLRVRYVLDMAEIPTFQVMRAHDASGVMTAAELRSWAQDEIAAIAPALHVNADGDAVALRPARPSVATRPGAGGLPTLYWVEDFRASVTRSVAKVTIEDTTFPDRIGWKDVDVLPATEPTDELRHYPNALLGSPRDLTSVEIDVHPNGLRVLALDSGDGAQTAPPVSAMRMNALSDLLARGTKDPWIVVLTMFAAIGLGALHAAEPGHGKTLMAVSLVGARATTQQAILLASGLTLAHTAGVLILGGALLVAANWIVPEAIYPWITLLSGVTVVVLGAAALRRFVLGRRGVGHNHGHGDGHDHGHSHDHDQSLPAGGAPLDFRGVMLVAMGGNIAPCPAALVALLAALALHEVGFGLAVVVAFSLGLAAVLTILGIALVRGAVWISHRPQFDKITTYAPLVSACVISVIGAVMLGQGAAAGAFDAPPFAVAALAIAAVAAFALSPGHAHGHEPTRPTAAVDHKGRPLPDLEREGRPLREFEDVKQQGVAI
jgi:nickel/cobalt exporter